jgi:Domain of unknown function (DUF5615)
MAGMRLELEENLGWRIAESLREAGHDVATVRDEELSGADDDALFARCRQEGRLTIGIRSLLPGVRVWRALRITAAVVHCSRLAPVYLISTGEIDGDLSVALASDQPRHPAPLALPSCNTDAIPCRRPSR